jgi:hypothetical protein
MTYTDCLIKLAGLKSITNSSNPPPFRDRLPPSRPGHYWAPAVIAFAKARRIRINYVLDNETPRIVVTGPELKELLLDAYGADDPFFISALPYFGLAYRFSVYADDF